MAFTISVSDQAVIAALNRLQDAVEHPKPFMQSLGEDVMARIKGRFSSASGPDGQPWTPNSRATLEALLWSKSGNFAAFSNVSTRKQGVTRAGDKKGYFLKDGRLGKKGQDVLMSKRPLHGDSGDLARQFHVSATDESVTIGNSMIYAA